MMLKENVVPRATNDQARTVERPPTRRGELDVLRALVVVGLVFFHSAVIFGPGEFPVKAAAEQRLATVFLAFGATWGMPLLFTISGMGVWYSLRSRSATAFMRERLRRLGVPLLVGLLTLVPLQVWLGMRRAGDPSADAGFFLRFWDVRAALDFPFVVEAAPDGQFETGHLWFLVCLLGFSAVFLPGFAMLRRPEGRHLVGRLAGLLARPGGVLLLAVPLVAVEVSLGSEVGQGGWHHGSYALFLAYGFLAAADQRIGQAFRRQWRPSIALAGMLFLACGAVFAAASAHGDPLTEMGPLAMVFRLLKSLDGLLWVVAILGFANSRVARPRKSPTPGRANARRLGAYLNDAVLPFYVLHETAVVVIAYFILAWEIGPSLQYLLISTASLVATLLLYEFAVRRSPVTRMLFGLKPVRRHDNSRMTEECAAGRCAEQTAVGQPARAGVAGRTVEHLQDPGDRIVVLPPRTGSGRRVQHTFGRHPVPSQCEMPRGSSRPYG
jgi:surface polysaccharide O-acyltransferase-like enzyme